MSAAPHNLNSRGPGDLRERARPLRAHARTHAYTMDTRVALVSGCSSGIGAALAQQLVAAGWIVVATMHEGHEQVHARADAGALLEAVHST